MIPKFKIKCRYTNGKLRCVITDPQGKTAKCCCTGKKEDCKESINKTLARLNSFRFAGYEKPTDGSDRK